MLTKKLAALAAILLLSGLSACADDRPRAEDENTDEPTAASCDYVEGGEAVRKVNLPPTTPEVSGEVEVTIKTSVGDIPLVLDADRAPCTVNSFVSLAEQDYYDDTDCHRMAAAPGFAFLQCGDPTATGAGGPGYTIPDELLGDEVYDEGVVAMAKTPAPNSGGGQFFMVFGDTTLDGPNYTIFGRIEPAGLEVLKEVGKQGTSDPSGVGAPNERVTFEDVVIS